MSGFVRFRLQQYRGELQEIVEYAIDEFLMEKQYQEFISLLQYFVYIQDAEIPFAHLMHKRNHEFSLFDEQMRPIQAEEVMDFSIDMIGKDANFEDLIVSTLISVAPEKIYIHTREPDLPVIRTIQQIFEDRTMLCLSCSTCSPVLDMNPPQKFPLDF